MISDTIAAYQKTIHENYNSSVNIARMEEQLTHEAIEQAENERTLMSSAIDNAWHYSISVEAMQKIARGKNTLKQVKLPPQNHVWIDLSSPLPLSYSQFGGYGAGYQISRAPIAAMWFYAPDLERLRLNQGLSSEPGRWILQLITPSGHEHDAFFYDVQQKEWSLARNEEHRQHEIEKHLNTWRNRLREALFIIQQNAYRPSAIVS